MRTVTSLELFRAQRSFLLLFFLFRYSLAFLHLLLIVSMQFPTKPWFAELALVLTHWIWAEIYWLFVFWVWIFCHWNIVNTLCSRLMCNAKINKIIANLRKNKSRVVFIIMINPELRFLHNFFFSLFRHRLYYHFSNLKSSDILPPWDYL